MRYYDEYYYDEGMRTIFGWAKLVTTRKPHPCDTCPSFTIPAGTRTEKFCYKTTESDGIEHGYHCPTSYWHNTCMKVAQERAASYAENRSRD